MSRITTPLITGMPDKKEKRKQERKVLTGAIGACLVVLALFNNFDADYDNKLQVEQKKEAQIERSLSINLGDGNCTWTKPTDAPQHEGGLFSTLLVAFPGSGKRTAFMQLEGMTELRAADDHNLTPDSIDKHFAFWKTSYPHHDGKWSFSVNEQDMNQILLLVRNPRWALPSYHQTLVEIEFSTTWAQSYILRDEVYTRRPPLEDWYLWREQRFEVEIKKWGWFIDYWMEGGVLRDIFSNKLTTAEHFARLSQPIMYAEAELIAEQTSLGNVAPVIDDHCVNDLDTCRPVAIASFERMIDPETGPAEIGRFVSTIENKTGLEVIEEEARACVWNELITNQRGGVHTYPDRDQRGPEEAAFGFTLEQMETIEAELLRVVEKYSGEGWVDHPNAVQLVEYIDGYIVENEAEMETMRADTS